MNKPIGLLLVGYSLLLSSLSCFAYYIAPEGARPTLVAGVVGGTLCLVWGVRAVAGGGGKALPILTLIPVTYTLLPQTFAGWSKASEGIQGGRMVAAVTTLLLALSLGMVVRIAWSGVVFDVRPGESCQPAEKAPRSGQETRRSA